MNSFDNGRIVLHHGDCLDKMQHIPDQSVDLVLTDPPYGTTACKWDSVIPFDAMWKQLKRIIKPKGAIVLFGSQPFTSALVMSNPAMFRYGWIWNKKKGGNIFNLKYSPYKIHEDVSVFSIDSHNYYPIMEVQEKRKSKTYGIGDALGGGNYGDERIYEKKNPKSIIEFSNATQKGKFHPTQKPVSLLEYLILTYTQPDELVLDCLVLVQQVLLQSILEERSLALN
jgi:site-specific DNA-methyltransferase (adenine-specific)